MSRSVTQGWRYFQCGDCERQWRTACRDHQSPSGEACSNCGAWATPHAGDEDLTLPVDAYGNLALKLTE